MLEMHVINSACEEIKRTENPQVEVGINSQYLSSSSRIRRIDS